MKKRLFSLILIMVAVASVSSAQGRRGLRINEVMVQNESSIVDDYGCRHAWIELFNSTFGPLEISSVYLTTDSTQKTMYAVPLGDVNTKMPKRQHVVFWADAAPDKGTFHTSLTLEPGKDNWIGIYDADGIHLIDSVTVPATLLADQTFARSIDGEDQTWEVRDGSNNKYITPSSNNIIKDTNSKVERFAKEDENGFAMTVMAMCIVFGSLLVLCLSFYVISKIGAYVSKHNKAKSQGANLRELKREDHPEHDSGEEIAAIAMALHDHLDTHDQENTILTINKVKRAYSPWSSKIYGLRETPRH